MPCCPPPSPPPRYSPHLRAAACCSCPCCRSSLQLCLLTGNTCQDHRDCPQKTYPFFQTNFTENTQQTELPKRSFNYLQLAYKGGITQITRQGVDTMVDVLYEDLDEEKTTLQNLLPDIVFQNSARRSHHIKGLLTLAKGMDKSLKSKSKMTTKACLARRKRSIAKTAPYHKRTRSALKKSNTEAMKSTVEKITGTWANNIGSHWSWPRTGIFFLMGPSPQQPPGLPTGDSTGDYD